MRIGVHGLVMLSCAATIAYANDVREHTRSSPGAGTSITKSQATDLTLTLTTAEARQIQTWVRSGGEIDIARKVLTVFVDAPDAELLKVGQRARCFPLRSRSSMYQGKITRVIQQNGRVMVDITLSGQGHPERSRYVAEIVVERGEFLSIPNEAIIEEAGQRVVYVQHHPGHYVPREIKTGLQGELYTQVVGGLDADDQVVTLGSFFVDAEYKLKSAGANGSASGHEHHHH